MNDSVYKCFWINNTVRESFRITVLEKKKPKKYIKTVSSNRELLTMVNRQQQQQQQLVVEEMSNEFRQLTQNF